MLLSEGLAKSLARRATNSSGRATKSIEGSKSTHGRITALCRGFPCSGEQCSTSVLNPQPSTFSLNARDRKFCFQTQSEGKGYEVEVNLKAC
jgi:hypothetical protein